MSERNPASFSASTSGFCPGEVHQDALLAFINRLLTQGGQSEADGTLSILVIGYSQSPLTPGGQSEADSTLSIIVTG